MKEDLINKIKHLEELSLKDDLDDNDYEELNRLKLKLKEKEDQKNKPKQVIVIRKDLNMNAGKLAAQVAHASLGIFTQEFKNNNSNELNIKFDLNNKHDKAKLEWLKGRFTKVILYVKSEKELLDIHTKALNNNIPNCLIEDYGFTCFNEPTKTCLALGPCYPEDLIELTKKLQLYKD